MKRVLASLICVVTIAGQSRAGQFDIYIENDAFTPDHITVNLFDAVRWVNLDQHFHSVDSTINLFHSGALGYGAQFVFVFEQVGTYGYFCGMHNEGGTVEVVPEPGTIIAMATGGIVLICRRRRKHANGN